MQRSIARAFVAAAIATGWAANASAAELFTHSYDVQGSFSAPAGGALSASLSVMTGVEAPDWATVNFGPFTPADVGRTVTLTPAVGGDWGLLTGRLTDGTRHVMFFEWRTPNGGGGQGNFEPEIIWRDPADPRIDLAGYQIDSLSLRLDRLSISTPPGGGLTDITGAFTLSADGHLVPEPAGGAMVLLLTGATMTLRKKRESTR